VLGSLTFPPWGNILTLTNSGRRVHVPASADLPALSPVRLNEMLDMKTLAAFLLFPITALAAPARVIALDGWHNNEKLPHYRWEANYPGGYSQLGDLLKGMGGELRTIHEPLSARTLSGVDCLIVADPDTPEESDDPKYFTPPEIAAVGGVGPGGWASGIARQRQGERRV
jgi:hypothetical protein